MKDQKLLKIYSAYLPFNLQLSYLGEDEDNKYTLRNIDYNESEKYSLRLKVEGKFDNEHDWMFKPYLYEISYFEEYFAKLFDTDIDVRTFLNEDFIVESGFESIKDMIEKHEIEWWPHGVVKLALKHHFNIFDLSTDFFINKKEHEYK